jgi:hypothetical protein
VIAARPASLWRSPASRRVIAAIASDDRLERYRQHTGIDPRELVELVWAEHDEGSILAVRGPFDARLAVAEMAGRMLPVEASADDPFVRRVGHYQGERRDITAIADGAIVAVTGTPALAASILARARGEDESPGALAQPAIAELLLEHAGAPVLVVAPRHLELPPSGIAILLAREDALAGTLTPTGPDALAIAVDLRGEFPPGAAGNFQRLVESLAESDLGSAIGMRDALGTLEVQADDGRVVLRATVPAAVVAAGLRVLFDAEIAELVAGPSVSSGGARESDDAERRDPP